MPKTTSTTGTSTQLNAAHRTTSLADSADAVDAVRDAVLDAVDADSGPEGEAWWCGRTDT
ncbi:hypothetical protein AB0R12_16350 [Streptomyces niveus]|uniref:hypothetical protein n=1 Tax=Streptomyces niveus TaxID=193462 RepID=UPI003423AE60